RFRYRAEVAIETFLGRLVVVGIDHEGARGPRLPGVAGGGGRFRGGGGPRPRDDVGPAARPLGGGLHAAPVLVVAQGRRLSRGAARYDAVRALGHVHLDKLLELGLVHLAVGEGSDERDDGTLEHGAHSETLHGSRPSARGSRFTLALKPEILQESSTPVAPRREQARLHGHGWMRYYSPRPAAAASPDAGHPQGEDSRSVPHAPGCPGGLTAEVAAQVRERFGTPCYVYDRFALEAAAREALAFPAPHGLTLRYAMKANPSHGILTLFRDLDLDADGASDFDVDAALRAGFSPKRVQLTSQSPARRPAERGRRVLLFNACSRHQHETFGRVAPGAEVSVRVSPGQGSASPKRTNSGGPA